jgi:branched-chain amino acid transport system permease protein
VSRRPRPLGVGWIGSGDLADLRGRARERRAQLAALAAFLVVLAVLPAITTNGVLAVVTTDLVFLQLCYAWNLVGGFLGELSLGHMIFWAAGSFGVVFALNHQIPVVLMVGALMVAGVLAGMAMAGLIRLARLEGLLYVAIFTLVLGALAQSIAENWSALGASVGVVSVRLPGIGPLGQYEIIMVLVAVAACVNVLVALTSRGSRWRALRDDPRAAATCGIPITRERVAGYGVSAALCVLGGAFQGYYLGSASGDVSLDVSVLITVSLAVFVGGPGTILGPFVGWVVIYGLGSVVTSVSTSVDASLYAQIVELGAALVALRLIVPRLGDRDLLSGLVRALALGAGSRFGRARVPASAPQPAPVSPALPAGSALPAAAPRAAAPGTGAAPEPGAAGSSRAAGSEPLVLDRVRKSFGQVEVLRAVSFEIRAGEVVGLLGVNGAGKSTLCNLLSGLLPADGGAMRIGATELSAMSAAQRAAFGVGRSFQTPRLFASLSLAENLAVVSGISRREAVDTLAAAAVRADPARVSARAEFFARRLTEVARAMAMGTRLLLLDEPLAGLSEEEHAVVLGMARLAADQGSRVLIVEHLVPAIAPVADRLVVLAGGEVIADGPPREVLVHEGVVRSYLGQSAAVGT